MSILTVKDLHVQVEDKEILKGLNLEVKEGETHALMGPNGNGRVLNSFDFLIYPSRSHKA